MEHFAIFIEYLLSFFIFSRFILLWLYALYTKKKRILNQKKELENKGLHECMGKLKKNTKRKMRYWKVKFFYTFFSHSNTYYTFQISQFFFHFITWKLPTWDEESFYTSGKVLKYYSVCKSIYSDTPFMFHSMHKYKLQYFPFQHCCYGELIPLLHKYESKNFTLQYSCHEKLIS